MWVTLTGDDADLQVERNTEEDVKMARLRCDINVEEDVLMLWERCYRVAHGRNYPGVKGGMPSIAGARKDCVIV